MRRRSRCFLSSTIFSVWFRWRFIGKLDAASSHKRGYHLSMRCRSAETILLRNSKCCWYVMAPLKLIIYCELLSKNSFGEIPHLYHFSRWRRCAVIRCKSTFSDAKTTNWKYMRDKPERGIESANGMRSGTRVSNFNELFERWTH